jgi:neutral ceramidase
MNIHFCQSLYRENREIHEICEKKSDNNGSRRGIEAQKATVDFKRNPVHPVYFLLVFMVMALFFPLSTRADLRAGAARVSITPDVKARAIPLGGYAARKAMPSTGVHDPVYARALVLADGQTKAAIVSLDLCFLPANMKTEVAKRLSAGDTGIDAAHLFLSATHTHSAPDPLAMHGGNTFTKLKGWTPFDAELLKFTADRIAQAIGDANKALVPAQIGVRAEDTMGVNRNRRGDATVDPALTVLKVTRKDGSALASIVNFAAHPTLYDDKMMQVSADWPGVMCADIEKPNAENGAQKQDSGGSVCLFLNGAEGDASPNGVDDVKGDEKVTKYGHQLSALVQKQLDKITLDDSANGSTLAMWTQAVTLPPRKPNALFFLAAAQLGASMTQARELVNSLMPTTTQITFVRLGDLLLMGFPCEPSANIGLAAKKLAREAGIKTPAVVALTNDWLAYALTPEQYKAGKYEAVMSFYGEPFGPTLLDGVKSGLTQKPKEP